MTTYTALALTQPTLDELQDALRHRMYGAEPSVFLKAARTTLKYTHNLTVRDFNPTIERTSYQSTYVWQQCSILFTAIEVAPKDFNAIGKALRITADSADSADYALLVLMEVARSGIHPDTILDAVHLGYCLDFTYEVLVAHGPDFFAHAVAAGITPTEVHDFARLGRDRLGLLIRLRNTVVHPLSHSHTPRVAGL
jgi:hypothetical protein